MLLVRRLRGIEFQQHNFMAIIAHFPTSDDKAILFRDANIFIENFPKIWKFAHSANRCRCHSAQFTSERLAIKKHFGRTIAPDQIKSKQFAHNKNLVVLVSISDCVHTFAPQGKVFAFSYMRKMQRTKTNVRKKRTIVFYEKHIYRLGPKSKDNIQNMLWPNNEHEPCKREKKTDLENKSLWTKQQKGNRKFFFLFSCSLFRLPWNACILLCLSCPGPGLVRFSLVSHRFKYYQHHQQQQQQVKINETFVVTAVAAAAANCIWFQERP